MSELTPREIVTELDRYIIGQSAAKRAVAIALRNRWRRMQLDPALRNEVTPKNILMIGPTGVGKTEIARRLAHLANAPFIKVEATKFTEVGYVGKDVEQIVRDLADAAVKMAREQAKTQVRAQAQDRAEERILDALLPKRQLHGFMGEPQQPDTGDSETRQKLRKQLREGALDEREIEFETAVNMGVEIMAPPGMEEMTQQLRGMFSSMAGNKTQARKLAIKAARPLLIDDEAARLVNDEELKTQALDNCEQNGIVFIDEIDKVAQRGEWSGAGVSREGVQRDLLPLVEGSTVSTKHGPHSFHRFGCILVGQAIGSDSGIAGAFPDPRGIVSAVGGRFRAHPHRARPRADQAIRRIDGDRGRDAGFHRRRRAAHGRNSVCGK